MKIASVQVLIVSANLFLNTVGQAEITSTSSARPIHNQVQKILGSRKGTDRPSVPSSISSEWVLSDGITQRWDTTSNGWINATKVSYSYDGIGRQIGIANQYWDGAVWTNGTGETFHYDPSGNLDEHQSQVWDGLSWSSNSRELHWYDGTGRDTAYTYQMWLPLTSTWENVWKYSHAYDTSGKLIEYTNYNWQNSIWTLRWERTYTYDLVGNLTQELRMSLATGIPDSRRYVYAYDANQNMVLETYQNWNGTVWVNNSKDTAVYDASNHLTHVIEFKWNGSDWLNQDDYFLDYDATGNITHTLFRDWNDSTWVNTSQSVATYNASNKITDVIDLHWDGSSWINVSRDTSTYDANGNLIAHVWLAWNDTGWVNVTRTISTWQFVTAVSEQPSIAEGYSLSSNYPNPFNPSTQIRYSLAKAADVTLKVYDMIGREIATLVQGKMEAGVHTITWNAKDLPSGIYIYKIVAGDFVQTKKMVLLK